MLHVKNCGPPAHRRAPHRRGICAAQPPPHIHRGGLLASAVRLATLLVFADGVLADAALSCSADVTDIDADKGGDVTVEVLGLPQQGLVHCELGLAWDGWVLTSGEDEEKRKSATLRALRSGASKILCRVPPFPKAAEGPVMLKVVVNKATNGSSATESCKPIQLWYSTRLVASFGEQPYFAATWGELLVRTNASAICGRLRIRASCQSGQLADVPVSASARVALNVSFAGLDPDFDGKVLVELLRDGSPIAERAVRLVRVSERRTGRSAVDHKRRALLVDGRPFFPIGWFSTYLGFGQEITISSLHDMSRTGANSIMLYNLIGGLPDSTIFQPRGSAPSSAGEILDTAQALGIKVQVYLLDITRPLALGNASYWGPLEAAVRAWCHHPAVLSWYVADDHAGPMLPDIYKRIKQLDPHHLVTMAIAGSGDAYRDKYTQGADVIMVESYPREPDLPYATMNVISRWPLEFMPSVHCGRAWARYEDNAVFSPAIFRSQLYHALIAGATGEVWFAYRNAEGWNEPGIPLRYAGFQAASELLDLAPALLAPSAYAPEPQCAPVVTAAARRLGGATAGPTAVRARAFREEGGCVTLLVANSLNEPVEAIVQFVYGSVGIYDFETTATEALVPFELAAPLRRIPVSDGELVEWLPSLGTQAFRLNGSSSCALPELRQGLLEKPNLIFNPSFEQFGSYISAPEYWECGMTPWNTGSNCYADGSVRFDRRHAGRFVTGINAEAFQATPSIGWTYDLPWIGTYHLSIWALADVPMTLRVGTAGEHGHAVLTGWSDLDMQLRVARVGASFQELGRLELTDQWRRLQLEVELTRMSLLTFKVNTTGVLWLDAAQLILQRVVYQELPRQPGSANKDEAPGLRQGPGDL